MKIILNAIITTENINEFLERQKQKADKVDEFCKVNKIDKLFYRDSELEYEYIKKQGTGKGGANNG